MSMGKDIKKKEEFSRMTTYLVSDTVKGQVVPLDINIWRKNKEIGVKNIVDSLCGPN